MLVFNLFLFVCLYNNDDDNECQCAHKIGPLATDLPTWHQVCKPVWPLIHIILILEYSTLFQSFILVRVSTEPDRQQAHCAVYSDFYILYHVILYNYPFRTLNTLFINDHVYLSILLRYFVCFKQLI